MPSSRETSAEPAPVVSPSKRSSTSPYDDWISKNIDPIVGVPSSSFNFPRAGPPRGSRLLLLAVVTVGKFGEIAIAQGVDLRAREGVITLLQSVFQLTPNTLARASARHWVLEIPHKYPYDKLRRGVFGLSQTVGFVLLRPDPIALRTVEGFIANFWSKDVVVVRNLLRSEEMVESVVDTKIEVDGQGVGTGNLHVSFVLNKDVNEKGKRLKSVTSARTQPRFCLVYFLV
jgi:hypothetical protein